MKTTSHFAKTTLLLAFIFAMFVGNQVKAQTSELGADTKSEVEKLNEQFATLIQKKDFASIVDMYSDDATIIAPGGQKYQGRKAISEYWYSLSNVKSLKSESLNLGGNIKVVYEVGKWTVVSTKNGNEQTTTSDVVLIWKRMQDYSYKIQLNSMNNPVSTIVQKVEPYKAEKE